MKKMPKQEKPRQLGRLSPIHDMYLEPFGSFVDAVFFTVKAFLSNNLYGAGLQLLVALVHSIEVTLSRDPDFKE